MGREKYVPKYYLQLIDEVIIAYIETASMKNISLVNLRTDNCCVLTDPNILKTILRNLINNAIKFTRPEGFIKIYTSLNDNNIEITVLDNGVGMSNEIVNKLFKIENKVSTLGTTNEAGTGLGLILCKEFTEKLNGNICVESELGKGTKFVVSLPDYQLE